MASESERECVQEITSDCPFTGCTFQASRCRRRRAYMVCFARDLGRRFHFLLSFVSPFMIYVYYFSVIDAFMGVMKVFADRSRSLLLI